MNRFERSWLLFKRSLTVMNRNRQLIFFPVVVFFFTVLILLFFLLPLAFWSTGHAYTSAEHWKALGNALFTGLGDASAGGRSHVTPTPLAVLYGALLYFVSMFSATFFNVAFYHEILEALCERPVSIVRGMKFACTKWQAIVLWTLFAGLVGLIIKQIEERAGIFGSIVAKLIGLAWSIASVFAIPLIIYEQDANPFKVLKNSAGMLKRVWGEGLIGFIGLGFASNMILLASMLIPAAALGISIWMNNYWLFAVVAALWVVWMFAWSYLTSLAGNVYKGALYLYAAHNYIPGGYDQELLDSAWKYKK